MKKGKMIVLWLTWRVFIGQYWLWRPLVIYHGLKLKVSDKLHIYVTLATLIWQYISKIAGHFIWLWKLHGHLTKFKWQLLNKAESVFNFSCFNLLSFWTHLLWLVQFCTEKISTWKVKKPHSLIRAKIFTNYVFRHSQFSGVIQNNIENRCAIKADF